MEKKNDLYKNSRVEFLDPDHPVNQKLINVFTLGVEFKFKKT